MVYIYIYIYIIVYTLGPAKKPATPEKGCWGRLISRDPGGGIEVWVGV